MCNTGQGLAGESDLVLGILHHNHIGAGFDDHIEVAGVATLTPLIRIRSPFVP